ncbi:hypothetical protein ACFL96_09240 [Thermoproteota archaeon]
MFLEHPRTFFSIRGLAKELGVHHGTVSKHVQEILKIGLIRRTQGKYPLYKANIQSARLHEYRKQMMLFEYDKEPEVQRHTRKKGYIL